MTGKGKISSLADGKALVIPYDAQTAVTHPISIPEEMRELIKPGDQVAYVSFEDNTGAVIGFVHED